MKMTPLFKLEFYEENSRVLSWNDLIIDAIDETEQKATPSDIEDIQKQLAQIPNNPNMIFVSGVGCFDSEEEWQQYKKLEEMGIIPRLGCFSTEEEREKAAAYFKYTRRTNPKHVLGGFTKPAFYSPLHTPQNRVVSKHVPIIVQPVLKSFEGTVHGRIEIAE